MKLLLMGIELLIGYARKLNISRKVIVFILFCQLVTGSVTLSIASFDNREYAASKVKALEMSLEIKAYKDSLQNDILIQETKKIGEGIDKINKRIDDLYSKGSNGQSK